MRSRKPETMVQEFARLAMELAVLNPERLHEIGEEMLASRPKRARKAVR